MLFLNPGGQGIKDSVKTEEARLMRVPPTYFLKRFQDLPILTYTMDDSWEERRGKAAQTTRTPVLC